MASGVRDLDVLVTCLPHTERLSMFPEVRGYYLAKHLARSGLRAEFRPLPVADVSCDVLICSEYQCEMDWFDRHLAAPLSRIDADRRFCLVDSSLYGRGDHFSREVCEWFGDRGGVLCHLADEHLEPYEHWIGIGVDAEVVRPAAEGRRDLVVFDFPHSNSEDPASTFDVSSLEAIRKRLPTLRLIGTGTADAPIRDAFDAWLTYGAPHPVYVAAAFSRATAVVPGCAESLGLALAEAQVAGACVVSSEFQVKRQILVPEAAVPYTAHDAGSLADALAIATTRDATRIRAAACSRFDFAAVAARTREAIGKGTVSAVVTRIPTYVVIAVKDRHEMTERLLSQLDDADEVFVFDNGSRQPFPGSVLRPDSTVYALWNEGLRAARTAVAGAPHNVAVLNNDLEVPPGFLTDLARGLRHTDDTWIAYPNWEALAIPAGVAQPVTLAAKQHLSGWAFMLRGEAGLAFDERFEWWYGDDDIQRQVEAAGRRVVCVGGVTCRHLEAGQSTAASPELRAKADADRQRFIRKWDRPDPSAEPRD